MRILTRCCASPDKQMHALDYERALGDILEYDDTIKATLAHLEKVSRPSVDPLELY